MFQRTIRSSIAAEGVGVHSGRNVKIALHPAPENTGVVFRRVDLTPTIEIPARAEMVVDTRLSTCIGIGEHRIGMVEHLLSAVAGMGVDNLYIDVNDSELPIMDGSSSPYIFLLQSAGIVLQETAEKIYLVMDKEVKVGDSERFCSIKPYPGFKVSFVIDYDHPNFNDDNQKADFEFSSASYLTSLCRARTFGFVKDKEIYKAQNLALGSSLENAIWLADDHIVNNYGLRYNDEFVKHKVLDAIGDLYLLSYCVIGHFEGYKSGHSLNNELLKAIISDPSSYHLEQKVGDVLFDEFNPETVSA